MKEKNYLCNRIQQAEPTILCHVNSTFIYPHNFMCNPVNQFFVGAQEMPSNAETVISGIQKTRTYQPCCQCLVINAVSIVANTRVTIIMLLLL